MLCHFKVSILRLTCIVIVLQHDLLLVLLPACCFLPDQWVRPHILVIILSVCFMCLLYLLHHGFTVASERISTFPTCRSCIHHMVCSRVTQTWMVFCHLLLLIRQLKLVRELRRNNYLLLLITEVDSHLLVDNARIVLVCIRVGRYLVLYLGRMMRHIHRWLPYVCWLLYYWWFLGRFFCIQLQRLAVTDVTHIAMATIIWVNVRPITDITVSPGLICTSHILIIAFISVVCFNILRCRLLCLLVLLLPLVLLICRQSLFQGLLLENPVVHEIEVKPFSHEGFSEHWYYLLVVWTLLEFQFSRVI